MKIKLKVAIKGCFTMAIDLDVYSGKLIYKEVDFSFVFDGDELRLIPSKDKEREVNMWFMRPLGNGAYTFGDPLYIEDDCLIGKCNENGQKMMANRNKLLKTHIPSNNLYDALRLKTVEECHVNLPSKMILARYFYAITEMRVSSITG